MLKIANIPDPKRNAVAPSVYIDSVALENSQVFVDVKLYDTNAEWSVDDQLLENTFIYVSDGVETQKKLLKSITLNKKFKNKTIEDQFIFNTTSSNIFLSAWAGNENISGERAREQITINNEIISSNIGNTTFEYINKVKNLNLLNFDIIYATGSLSASSALQSDIFVSHRPDKKASIGFIFDLQKFLEINSSEYNILKNNEFYAKKILSNSSIDVDRSYFFKKNVTKNSKEDEKIKNIINVSPIDQDSYKFFVSVLDDNENIKNKSYYELGFRLVIKDYSSQLINNNFIKEIPIFIKELSYYKDLFILASKNKDIEDVEKYIFENVYESYLNNNFVNNFVTKLAPVCALLSKNSEDQFVSLFVSILHPLTTSIELLERLITFLNKLFTSFRYILGIQPSADNIATDITNYEKIFEKNTNISALNPYSGKLNYDYEAYYGLSVVKNFSLDEYKNTAATPNNSINEKDFIVRKLLEAKKYIPDEINFNQINLLSISNIYFGTEDYNLLLSLPQNSTNFYNDIFVKLREYNDFNFSFKKPETYYFQLFEEDIVVKSLSNRDNGSTNNLLKSTIFDGNSDTTQKSLEYAVNTGIRNLYFSLDKTQIIDIKKISGSFQYNAGLNLLDNPPAYSYSTEDISNIDLKSKILIYYNNFYSLELVENGSGSIMDIYKLNETLVNNQFSKKLKIFDEFFCVVKSAPVIAQQTESIFLIEKDVRMNYQSSYLNRSTIPAEIKISVNDI